jgi:flagellar basal-body rod modification protein FlgD
MTTPVSAVGAAAGTSGTPAADTSRSMLDPQAFLQLLVAQLQYQDPSSPVDTSAFMQQTATLSQVQTMNTMQSTLTALLGAQQAQAATELIGKTVTYVDSSGLQKSGVVAGASLLSTGATLKVDGADVALSAVVGVSATTPSTTTP